MNPRARKLLWVLFGILMIGSLFLAGPAHQLVHHGDDPLGSCDFCHLAVPEAPRFEAPVFWTPTQSLAEVVRHEWLREIVHDAQGHARAPPRQG